MGADIHYEFQAKRNGVWEKVESDFEITRNYELFSWLAGVRGSLDPIVEPRGLPDDLDYQEPAEIGELDENTRWFGEHSQTWYDLNEIITAESPASMTYGFIDAKDYSNWDGESEPAAWYTSVHGWDVVVEDENDADERATHIGVSFYTKESQEPEYIDIRDFIEACKTLKEQYPICRIVMGFCS